jgi:TPR repeat protein
MTVAASKGVPESQYSLGEMYHTGESVPADEKRALSFFRMAAANHYPPACVKMAQLLGYPNIESDVTNLAESHRYMLEAARAGDPLAQLNCASAYFRGDGGATNISEGTRWLETYAARVAPELTYEMSLCLLNGQSGFPENKPEGLRWLRTAAERECSRAQVTLANKLIKGVDLPRDPKEGIKWFRRAAEHGNAEAQNDLGCALETETGDTPDLVEVCKWYLLAKERGVLTAELNLNRLLPKLTRKQSKEAERRAREFQALPTPQPAALPHETSASPF